MQTYRQTAIKANLLKRNAMLTAIRHFFAEQGYLEVETPIRIPAPAPEAHIDAEPSGDWYLQTSPELCMKQLLSAGYERIFQICKCFRQKERGGRHLPEMTLLEWYSAGENYGHMMDQCQALISCVAQKLKIGPACTYRKRRIDLNPPWDRLSVARAFDLYGSLSMSRALTHGCFDEIMGLEIEPKLGWQRPVFLYDYPAACSALARLKPDQPQIAERFELYIGGLELCNGFSELSDPVEQRRRFENEIKQRRITQKAAYPMPDKFLTALGDMPEATGNALGVDRLIMLLTDTDCIDDVTAFIPEEL